jgi:PHD/YefM family antitoxin component YafN of YafNO toxin-antitoxin module
MVFAITSKNWGFALYLDSGNDFHYLSIKKQVLTLSATAACSLCASEPDKSAP